MTHDKRKRHIRAYVKMLSSLTDDDLQGCIEYLANCVAEGDDQRSLNFGLWRSERLHICAKVYEQRQENSQNSL